jgi:uncharacterized membrane protein HdeD (DUF308 family)
MPRITLLLGVILAILGMFYFVLTDWEHVTALIPFFFGILFMILGFVAGRENMRKHAMHAAATLGLLGVVGGLVMVIRGLMAGIPRPHAFVESAILAGLCAIFVGLCVKSFIDARRRRSQRAEM